MISDLGKLVSRRDQLDQEIQTLCTKLGHLSQERFVLTEAIRELVNDQRNESLIWD